MKETSVISDPICLWCGDRNWSLRNVSDLPGVSARIEPEPCSPILVHILKFLYVGFSDDPLLFYPWYLGWWHNYGNKSKGLADLADVKRQKKTFCNFTPWLNWINVRSGHSPYHMRNMSADAFNLTQQSFTISLPSHSN